jgi:hypothetical protein
MNFFDDEFFEDLQDLIIRWGHGEIISADESLFIRFKDLNFTDIFSGLLSLDGTWMLDGQHVLSGMNGELGREVLSFSLNLGLSDNVTLRENDAVAIKEVFKDNFSNLVLEGTWLLDGSHTLSALGIEDELVMGTGAFEVHDIFRSTLVLNGQWKLDGSETLDGYSNVLGMDRLEISQGSSTNEPQLINEGFEIESSKTECRDTVSFDDEKVVRLHISESVEQFGVPLDDFFIGRRLHFYLDGTWAMDGSRLLNSTELLPVE